MTAFYIGQHEIDDEAAFADYLKETMPFIERLVAARGALYGRATYVHWHSTAIMTLRAAACRLAISGR
jgi:hypothetical protein